MSIESLVDCVIFFYLTMTKHLYTLCYFALCLEWKDTDECLQDEDDSPYDLIVDIVFKALTIYMITMWIMFKTLNYIAMDQCIQ